MAEHHRPSTRSDFQRFCAGLRTSLPSLDDLVEGLRALEASALRPLEKGRFAHSIARHLSERFHPSAVRAVASVTWSPEIGMVLRSYAPSPGGAPSQGEAPSAVAVPRPERPPERGKETELDQLRELSRGRGSPLTVVFMGDEDEHRSSIEHLKSLRLHCVRESSLAALDEVFAREVVVGLVVGASWWAPGDPSQPPPPSPRGRLLALLGLSSMAWVKLVRAPAWAGVEDRLTELYTSLYFSDPPRSRLAVEDQAAITSAELRSLTRAAHDLSYAERGFRYEFQPSVAQDRIIRAVASRYLREKYPVLHARETGFRVRALAHRGEQGVASVVSVSDTDVSFVVKVSPCRDAREEARRFVAFAHGAAFDMELFCHATHGALVVAPIGTRLGEARSLESVLATREQVTSDAREAVAPCASLIDSAIAALERFSRQVRPEGVTTLCCVDYDETAAMLGRIGPLVVAGETIDLRSLHARGLSALSRSSRSAVVHGDAHAENILFSVTDTAILIDYECAGLGPACYDLCTLWIFVLATRFVAVIDETAMVALLRELLAGASFEALEATWGGSLRFAVNHQVLYLAAKALAASVAVMEEHGLGRADVHGIVAVILCRELLNPQLQQFSLRCALAATQAALRSG